jgi:hypothetical protein
MALPSPWMGEAVPSRRSKGTARVMPTRMNPLMLVITALASQLPSKAMLIWHTALWGALPVQFAGLGLAQMQCPLPKVGGW